jgi:putative transcriptional regulator
MNRMISPTPTEVKNLRKMIQSQFCLGITDAQDKCASMVHVSRRSWQYWERGERTMHAAFWELLTLKTHSNKGSSERTLIGV